MPRLSKKICSAKYTLLSGCEKLFDHHILLCRVGGDVFLVEPIPVDHGDKQFRAENQTVGASQCQAILASSKASSMQGVFQGTSGYVGTP